MEISYPCDKDLWKGFWLSPGEGYSEQVRLYNQQAFRLANIAPNYTAEIQALVQAASMIRLQATNVNGLSSCLMHCSVSPGSYSRIQTLSSYKKPSRGHAAQTSSAAVGTSPLWSSRKWHSRRVRQTWSQRKTAKQTMSPSKKRRPSSEHPWGNALRRTTSFHFLDRGSRLWSWDHALATTDSMPTCPGIWSWYHHQPATAVLKTRWPNIYCRDARFCRKQGKMFG